MFPFEDLDVDDVGHPNLSAEINANIRNSVIAGGATPSKLPANKRGYKVTTSSRVYELLKEPHGAPGWTIKGHPRYCPNPVLCNIHGSTWGGSMIKTDWIGIGMHLEIGLMVNGEASVITTSEIQDVEEI